jgi:hypothetical protein
MVIFLNPFILFNPLQPFNPFNPFNLFKYEERSRGKMYGKNQIRESL